MVLYHEDDKTMFVDNGVLASVRRHLVGVRNVYVLSRSNATFRHLLDHRTIWFDEARVPFSPQSWAGLRSARPLGWLYQQALKLWAVQHLPRLAGMCDNVLISDADTLWLRDFDVVTPVPPSPDAGGSGAAAAATCRYKFKYNLASMTSGAWYGDITNPEVRPGGFTSNGRCCCC